MITGFWLMILAQMSVYMWFTLKGGKLGNGSFLIYTVGMLLGQFAAGVDTYKNSALLGFAIQAFFFTFTVVGGIQRLRQMRKERTT